MTSDAKATNRHPADEEDAARDRQSDLEAEAVETVELMPDLQELIEQAEAEFERQWPDVARNPLMQYGPEAIAGFAGKLAVRVAIETMFEHLEEEMRHAQRG